MDNSSKYFLFIAFIFAFFITAGFCSAEERVFYMSQLKEKEGIVSLKKNADKIDILAPQFYGVTEKLELAGGLDAELKELIEQKNIRVMPLVSNSGFKQEIMHDLLVSPEAQERLIESLVAEAKREKYIGWQYDFENISYLDKNLFSAFIEKSAKTLQKNGFILSVAVVSRSTDYENSSFFRNWGGAFDYARLAKAVDFISLMTYDDPKSVGPVASVPYINRILSYVKNKIPPEKLSLGIPLYYWGWTTSPFKKVALSGSYSRLSEIKSTYRYNSGFDTKLGASWISYYSKGKQYEIWHQDKQSFSNKLDIINKNNFRGFSAWVMGVEDPKIWSTLGNK